MTSLNQLAPHTTTAGRSSARTRRSFDAVLASYIRELAAAGDTTPSPRDSRDLQLGHGRKG
jgi:hypothetical protein